MALSRTYGLSPGHLRCSPERGDRPARIEPLEQRLLLSGSPPAPPEPLELLPAVPQHVPRYDQPVAQQTGSGVLDIYVEPGLLASIQASVDQYVADVTAEGYTVTVQEFSGDEHQLRAQLQDRYAVADLEGALLIGDMPTLMFTHDNDFYGNTSTFIHDLYFMDLDGTYVLNETDPDEHVDGTGDIEPEIYVSRITPSGVTGMTGQSEAALIESYFARAHAYRTGSLFYENRGILWSDDDWQWPSSRMGSLYDEVLNIRDPAETTRQSYVDSLTLDYETILEMIHSSVTYHAISGTGGGNVSSTQVYNINPRQGFYNLWNCSSARFTYSNNLIATYVYSGDYGLNAVGSAKTGSMLSTTYYYSYQGQGGGHSVGQAFHYWWNSVDNHSDSMKSWHYGMTMQGDPTLRPAVMGDRPDNAPTDVDLLAASDTGEHDDDDVTQRNNSAPSQALDVLVSGTIPGATVTLYADGVPIGTAVATDETVVITTDGATALADGLRAITARQEPPGEPESADSPALDVTVDTQAPVIDTADGCNSIQVVLTFLEDMNSVTAETFANYQLDPFLPIERISLCLDLRTILITYDEPLVQFLPYTLTVNNIEDLAGNVIAPDTQREVTWAFDPELIPAGSEWKYLDDGSDQGTAWRGLGFSDDEWSVGSAQLGYGDGDEATEVGYGGDPDNKYATTYFRQNLFIDDVSKIEGLRFRLLRDDGAVVYVNGNEVERQNMADGDVDYLTYADDAVGGTDEDTFFEFDAPATDLQNGANVVSVEIHQFDADSSDISFDLALTALLPSFDNVFVEAGSVWRYLDDGSDQGTEWRESGFDDDAWASGPAELGYGDGDEATVVDYGGDPDNKYITTYFRHSFDYAPSEEIAWLMLRLLRDDGAVVYLNGQEVVRDNMPTGTIDCLTLASSAASSTEGTEMTFYPFYLDPGLLLEGTNVLAVEVHQVSATSSDISLDVELRATIVDLIQPVADILDVSPDPRNVPVDEVEIVFPEPVTGLDLADLSLTRDGGANLLTGAELLTTSDELTYVLSGLTGLTDVHGAYQIALTAEGSGIVDRAGNEILAGATSEWVMDTVAPAVTADELVTDDSTPPLSGTVDDPEAIVLVTVAGQTYEAVNHGDGTWLVSDDTINPPLDGGVYDILVEGIDPAGNSGFDTSADELIVAIEAEIVGRYIFYNNSAWDGGDPAPNDGDDSAIAPDPAQVGDPHLGKTPLLPGEVATFQNYTSYSRGINGIMVDIAGMWETSLSEQDFVFRVGNDDEPGLWPEAPDPLAISVREGLGQDGADRVTITWADNAIQNEWLQVTVKAGFGTGLFFDQVFYWGNAIGETGNEAGNTFVNSADRLGCRANPHNFFDPAAIDDAYDFDRDGNVNSADRLICRANTTNFFTALKLITAPGAGVPAPAAIAEGDAPTAALPAGAIAPDAGDPPAETHATALPIAAVAAAPRPALQPAASGEGAWACEALGDGSAAEAPAETHGDVLDVLGLATLLPPAL